MKKENIEKCAPCNILSKELYTDNIIYKSCKKYLDNCNTKFMLLAPKNDVLKLSYANSNAPDSITADNLNITIKDAIATVIGSMYSLHTEGIDNNILQNLYYLDTGLCVMFCEGKNPIYVTRNSMVLDSMQPVPMCCIGDIHSYLYLSNDNICQGIVTVVKAIPTAEGYQFQYDTLNIKECTNKVIIPYVWYQYFLNNLRNTLRCGACKIKFMYNGIVRTVSATTSRISYNDDVRKASDFIYNNPVNQLGKLQFVCNQTSRIYCINVKDIISVSEIG